MKTIDKFKPHFTEHSDIFNDLYDSILNTYEKAINIQITHTKVIGTLSYCSLSFDIDNTNIRSLFYIDNTKKSIINDFKFKFNDRHDIFKKLKINNKDTENLIKLFIQMSFKFQTIYKSSVNYKKLSLLDEKNIEGYYSFPYVDSHTIFFNEGFRQKKDASKKPNKSSMIGQTFSFKLNNETKKIERILNIKFPFLYKNKIDFYFNVDNKLDLSEIEKEFEVVYLSKIKNHFSNSLKIKLDKIELKDIPQYKSLIEMANY